MLGYSIIVIINIKEEDKLGTCYGGQNSKLYLY